jgi:hypothetical protein
MKIYFVNESFEVELQSTQTLKTSYDDKEQLIKVLLHHFVNDAINFISYATFLNRKITENCGN